MPNRPEISRHDPSFFRFPINNARTGFQPVSLPLIFVEPHRRDSSGVAIADSSAFNLKFFIAEAPDPARVAGPFNTGILIPESDRFTLEISALDLSGVAIDLTGRVFRDADGTEKTFATAVEGDFFEYSLMQNKATDLVPFFPDANYYDLSAFLIDVEDLPKPDRYIFVWESSFFKRVISANDEFLCIDTGNEAISQFKLEINHPGEVHNEMFLRTPPLYLDPEAQGLAEDSTLKLYRPFADALQDIFDEQSLIDGINHIDKIPAQLIPYLAFLIGWDLPNFPGVGDNVRRSILRSAVELQQLKGTRRAIIELFDILGFSIDILNLWFSTDGSTFIAPGEDLPAELDDEEITTEEVCQIDVLVADFNTPGFTPGTDPASVRIPLLHKPTGNITLDGFLVVNGSATDDALRSISDSITEDPGFLEAQSCIESDGFLIPQSLLDSLPSDPVSSSSAQVLVDATLGRATDDVQVGLEPPISAVNITYNKDENFLNLVFDHHLDFEGDTKLYIFGTYKRDKITVPSELSNLRSNRFDIRILLKENNEVPDQDVLDFTLNFLFKLKAFHSLLRKIIFTQVITEVYNVQDFCIGGDVRQDPNFDGGRLQIPPPVSGDTEDTVGDCDPDVVVARGFKDEDIAFRNDIINGLIEEHETWKALDDTHELDPLLDSLLRITPSEPDGTACQFTQLGQDRVEFLPDEDLDHNVDARAKLCDDTVVPLPDNCFKGRVDAQLELDRILLADEKWRCKPCSLGMGTGVYWTMPSIPGQRANLGEEGQVKSRFLGKKLRQYNDPVPSSIHFDDRPLFDFRDEFLAIQRPSLCVDKDNMGFPGHRFVGMGNLEEDFTHPTYRVKPWDDQYSLILCDENRVEENGLNAFVGEDSNGIETIFFDDADLIYLGNGIEADISSFGTHDDRSFLVTHKVFMSTAVGHESLTLDPRVTETSETDIEFDSNTGFDPLFKSFNATCSKDFIDGYPADTGRFDADIEDFDRNPSGGTDPDPLSCMLGLPERDGTDATSLFTFGSQILLDEADPLFRFYEPFRLDCACLEFDCSDATGVDITTALPTLTVPTCTTDLFRENGFFESNCDKLELDLKVILAETIGTCSTRLDGTIPNMLCQFELDSSGNAIIPDPNEIPATGDIFFEDDYGIQYIITWIKEGNRIDIVTTTKQPRVWGDEDPGGFVTIDEQGRRLVFRQGIITTCRQILEIQDDGSSIVIGEGCEQEIDLFQSNFACGDAKPVNDLCFQLNCQVLDEVEFQVTCGPRWADPDEELDDCVIWTDLADGTGPATEDEAVHVFSATEQPFSFIDVWGVDDDVVSICCTPGTEATGA